MRQGPTTGSKTAPPEVRGLQGLSQRQCDKAATSHSLRNLLLTRYRLLFRFRLILSAAGAPFRLQTLFFDAEHRRPCMRVLFHNLPHLTSGLFRKSVFARHGFAVSFALSTFQGPGRLDACSSNAMAIGSRLLTAGE